MSETNLDLSLGSASSSDFDPSSISGLALWADSASGVTAPGNAVTQLVDRVGGRVLTPSSVSPVYSANGGLGGRPKITIAAGKGLIASTSPVAVAGDRTVLVVMQTSNIASVTTGDIVRFRSVAPSWALRYDNAGHTDSDEASYNNAASYVGDTAPHVLLATYHSGSVSPYYIDNVSKTLTSGTAATNDDGTAGFQIGQGIGGNWQGDFYWVLVWNRVLSGAEISLAARGAGSTFGITVA